LKKGSPTLLRSIASHEFVLLHLKFCAACANSFLFGFKMLKIILVPSLYRVSGTPFRQIPLFPPLKKGMKGDFLCRLCVFAGDIPSFVAA
jgi:hypothetical protein